MVWQQILYEEMGVMLGGKIETERAMASTNCGVMMSGTRTSRGALR